MLDQQVATNYLLCDYKRTGQMVGYNKLCILSMAASQGRVINVAYHNENKNMRGKV